MPEPKPMDRADFVSSLLLTAFGIAVIAESLRLPRLEHQNINPYTVPGLLPGILGVAITLCAGGILLRAILRGGWRLGLSGRGIAAAAASATARRMGLVGLLTLVYALGLFGHVDFRLATAPFVFAFVLGTEWLAGMRLTARRVATALVLAVCVALVVHFLFTEVFYVRLPG